MGTFFETQCSTSHWSQNNAEQSQGILFLKLIGKALLSNVRYSEICFSCNTLALPLQ